jgi:recombination protein RecR
VLFDRWARAVDEASRLPTPRLLFEMAALDLCAASRWCRWAICCSGSTTWRRAARGAGARRPGAAAPPRGAAPVGRRPPPRGQRSSGVAPPRRRAPRRAPAGPVRRRRPGARGGGACGGLRGEAARRWRAARAREVVSLTAGRLTLAFASKLTRTRRRRRADEIEQVRSATLGRPTKSRSPSARRPAAAALRGRRETDAARRPQEPRGRGAAAPDHPSAPGLFGAPLKEIKTLAMSIPISKACSRPRSASRARWRACATSWAQDRRGRDRRRPVRCRANGRGEVLSLTIDPSIAGDKKMIEDLAVGAVNLALERARELAQAELARATGGCRCRPGCSEAERMFASPIARLVQQLGKLPASARRPRRAWPSTSCAPRPRTPAALAAAIAEVSQKIRSAAVCCDLTESDPCAVCRDARRDAGLVCVVAQPQDVVAIERTGGYRGRTTSCTACCRPSTASGRRTCVSPSWSGGRVGSARRSSWPPTPPSRGRPPPSTWPSSCDPWGCGASRIATGVPMGGELEYADRLTLARALDGRREI